MKVKFKEWDCLVRKQQYAATGGVALELIDAEDFEPIAMATVCVPDVPIHEDQVFIKDYSENEGILQALIDAGVVSQPLEWIEQGFVRLPLCKLLF